MRLVRNGCILCLVLCIFVLPSLALYPSVSAAQPDVVSQHNPQTTAIGISRDYITWMPVIYNRWPPVPFQPTLSVSAVATDGTYTLGWTELPARLASTYTLQEAADHTFTSLVSDICTTTESACAAQQKVVGTRYYRVRGLNDWGYGAWSDIRAVVVPIRGGIVVDTSSRQASLAYYQTNYMMSTSPAIGWTGSHSTCNPGTTSLAFRDAVLRRINYFRAMAGVPADITFSTISNRRAQAAALMMSVNKQLNHTPPTSWTCYSDDGMNGAGISDLSLGMNGWSAISSYMFDFGSANYAAGHRRWVLFPQTQVMGTGDIPSTTSYPAANALIVFDSHKSDVRPLTRDGFVAWPPPGYVPYQVVFARWSFSYATADFSSASVTMVSGGVNVSLSQAPVVAGYGENTLVWIPMGLNDGSTWPCPTGDTTYTITIHNVILGGQSKDFTYTVTIFDPGIAVQNAAEVTSTWANLIPPPVNASLVLK